MFNQWSVRRRISLGIHAGVVAIPFGFSTVSALLFWQNLFNSWWLAAPMVAVVDVLALLGLVLYVARIASPFVWLRHLLPFISIVPLCLELYALLEHNGLAIASAATAVVSLVLVLIAWQCFGTIERLFIDPIEAAREKAHEQVHALTVSLSQLREMEEAADSFVLERLRYHMPAVTVQTIEPESVPLSKSAQVKRLAMDRGVSESTVWRGIKKGTVTLTEE